MGLVLTVEGFIVLKSTEVLSYLPFPFFTAIFAYSVVVGLLLGEGADCRHHLVFLYCPQILTFYSPMISYRYYSGLELFVGVRDSHFIYNFALGATWVASFLRPAPWLIGCNLFAMLIVIFEMTTWMKKLLKESKVNDSVVNSSVKVTSGTPYSPV